MKRVIDRQNYYRIRWMDNCKRCNRKCRNRKDSWKNRSSRMNSCIINVRNCRERRETDCSRWKIVI